jgi:hypothetical protein
MTTEPNQTAPVENETPPIVAETTDASAADALEDLALTPAPSAQTSPTKRKKAFSKRTVEDLAIQPHRAADCVIIPGDSSEDGQRYAGTPLDDLRQNLPWGDVHETILTGLLASAEMIKHPDGHGMIAGDDDAISGAVRLNGEVLDGALAEGLLTLGGGGRLLRLRSGVNGRCSSESVGNVSGLD